MKKNITAIVLIFILLPAVLPPMAYAETVLTVSEGLRMATGNNRLVKIATQDMNMSLDDSLIAKSRLYPSVNASVSHTYLANQPGAHFGPQRVNTAREEFPGILLYATGTDLTKEYK